jgi:hypothetical protein
MKKSIKTCLLCLQLLIITAMPVAAETATLIWDQNTEPEVVGYKIYYQINAPDFPFNGTSLSEGPSPIIVDGSANTSLSINLPEDGNIYYFTATAFNDNWRESLFSNIIASEWIPSLLAPINNAVIDTVATFVWEQPPESYSVSFDLFYGTDPNLDDSALSVTAPVTFNSNWPQFKLNIALPLAILFSLLILIRSGSAKHAWRPVRVGLCIGIFALQASCGGGGGDDTSIPSTSIPSTSIPDTSVPDTSVPGDAEPDLTAPLFTNVVTDIYDTEYQVTDLQPDTQYYWKIVAVDNWGNPYESLTQKFTTLGN